MRKIIAFSALSLVVVGCLDHPSFLKSGTANMSQGSAPVLVATIDQDGGTTGLISAGAGGAQIITAGSASGVEGAQVSFPPGALTIDTSITMTEGEPLATNSDVTSALGLGSGTVSTSGASVAILSDQKIDAAAPFTVAIAAPSGAGLTAGSQSFAIVYKVYHAFEDKVVIGVIPASEISPVDGVLTFKTKYFGVYQAITTTVEVKAVAVQTKVPVQTKAQVVASQPSSTPASTSTSTSTKTSTGTGSTTSPSANKVQIISVSSPTAGKAFMTGDHIAIDVRFSDTVAMSANTILLLYMNTGPGKMATSLPAVDGPVIRFNYTVSAGDQTQDLDYATANALVVAGGTPPKDAAGNTPLLTLPAPGTAGSLGAYSNFVIDTAWETSTAPLSQRRLPGIAYDDDHNLVLIWGGVDAGNLGDGAIFDPNNGLWRPMSAGANVPTPRYAHTVAWGGGRFFVWGHGPGGVYDPVADSWVPIPYEASEYRMWPVSAWTGSRLLVWGGYNTGNLDTGAIFDPNNATTPWVSFQQATVRPDARAHHRSAWDPIGQRLFIWGGHLGSMSAVLNTGGVYAHSCGATDCWTLTQTTGAPAARVGHVVVWTGSRFIVWGGENDVGVFGDGGIYNPDNNTWDPIPVDANAPARKDPSAVWDPVRRRMLVFGGQNAGGTMLNEGLAFDPDTKTWTKLSTKNAPAEGGMEGRSVFGGGSAYFFGGNAGANTLNVLGRYTLP